MPLYEQESDTMGQPIKYVSNTQNVVGQLEAVFDAMADGVFVYDVQGQLIRTNAAARELLDGGQHSYSPSSSPQDSVARFRLRTPSGIPLLEEQWPTTRILRGEEFKGANAQEVLLQTLAGEALLVSLSGSPIRDAQGQIAGGVIVAHDITEHHRMEKALRTSEEQYRTIVQTANEGIWLMDANAHTLYTNAHMATMLGYTPEDLLQRSILDCIFPEDRASTRLRLDSNLLGKREQFEFRFCRSDGSVLETMASTSPTYDADGAIVGALGLFTDITARRHIEETLWQNEEMLRLALRNTPIAVFQQDRDLRYTWMYNPPSSTPEAIVGKADADFVSPEEAEHLTQVKLRVMATGQSAREEVQIVTPHGTRSELLTFEPLRDRTGTIIGLTGTSINITERKQLELRTHRALQALINMAQAIVQGVDETDSNQETLSASRQMVKKIADLTRDLLGCERLSLHQFEPGTECLLPLAVVGLSTEQEEKWWSGREPSTNSFLYRHESALLTRLHQQEVLTLDLSQPPYNESPNPYGIRSMLVVPLSLNGRLLGLLQLDYHGADHDYTPEEIALAKAAGRLVALVIERATLLASNQRLSEMVELAHDAVIVRDPASRVQFWNLGAQHLYGWTKQEALGLMTHTLLATNFPGSPEAVDTALAEEGQWEGILLHTSRNGAQLTVESRQILVRDASGKPSSILEINRDITDRERLAQERAAAQASENALREVNQLMDEFIGIASHELRTPLTTVKTSVQLARRQVSRLLTQDMSLDDALRHLSQVLGHLDRTERQIAMQNRLVSDLLDVSRIHANRLELHPDLCDLALLVREVIEDQRYITPERTLELTIATPGEILVLADADRIRQVISNYLSNALKYSASTSPVEILIEIIATQVRVSVHDQGPGLTPEQQEHIWERFYRVPGIEVRTGSGIGLGLGLHISRMIIERQRGQVGIDSERGEGSTFWFTLPLADPPSDMFKENDVVF